MARPGPSLYQKRTATRRRTADITRLADQYQRSVQAMTGEYEQAFGQYETQTKEKMAPYEEAVARYGKAMPQYEKQAAAYKDRLQSFEQRAKNFEQASQSYYSVLRDAAGNPVKVQMAGDTYTTELFSPTNISNRKYVPVFSPVPVNAFSGYDADRRGNPFWWSPQNQNQNKFINTGSVFDPSRSLTIQEGFLLQSYSGGFQEQPVLSAFANPGKFTETFSEALPTAPQAPVAPEIPAFESGQFDARRVQLETEFKREVGERRGARQRAVSRGGARPLLQGA